MFAKIRARRKSGAGDSHPPQHNRSTDSRPRASTDTAESRFSFSPERAPPLPLTLPHAFHRRNTPSPAPSSQQPAESVSTPLHMAFDFELPSGGFSEDFRQGAESAGLMQGEETDGYFGAKTSTSSRAPSVMSRVVSRQKSRDRNLNGQYQAQAMKPPSFDIKRAQDPTPSSPTIPQLENEKLLGRGSEYRSRNWSLPGLKDRSNSPLGFPPPIPQLDPGNISGRPSESGSLRSVSGPAVASAGLEVPKEDSFLPKVLSPGEMDLMNIGGGSRKQGGRSRAGTEGKRSVSEGIVNGHKSKETQRETQEKQEKEQKVEHKAENKEKKTEARKSISGNALGMAAFPLPPTESKTSMPAAPLRAAPMPPSQSASTNGSFLASAPTAMEATMFPSKPPSTQDSSPVDKTGPATSGREFVDNRDRAYSNPAANKAASPPITSPPHRPAPISVSPRPWTAKEPHSGSPKVRPPGSPASMYASWNRSNTLSPSSGSAPSPTLSNSGASVSGRSLRSNGGPHRAPSISGSMLSPKGASSANSAMSPPSSSERPASGISLHPSVTRPLTQNGTRLSWQSGVSGSSQMRPISEYGDVQASLTQFNSDNPSIPEVPEQFNKPKTGSPLAGSPAKSSLAEGDQGGKKNAQIPAPIVVPGMAPHPSTQSPSLNPDSTGEASSPRSSTDSAAPSPNIGGRSPRSAKQKAGSLRNVISAPQAGAGAPAVPKVTSSPPPLASPTIGMAYGETSEAFPPPQLVATRPKTAGVTSSVAGVNVPTHHTTSSKPEVKAEKRKTRLLNPMAFLGRRKTATEIVPIVARDDERIAQEQALAKQRTIVTKGVDKLPADFDPRIRGKKVHDFSAPRGGNRNFSHNDTDRFKQKAQQDQPPTSVSSPLAPTADSSSSASGRRSVHSPVFHENFNEETDENKRISSLQAERLENKDFLKRVSRQSTGPLLGQDAAMTASALPPFARRSQAWNPESMQPALFGSSSDDGRESPQKQDKRHSIAALTPNDHYRMSKASGFVSPIRHSMAPSALLRDSFSPVSPSSPVFSERSNRPNSEFVFPNAQDTSTGIAEEGDDEHTPRKSLFDASKTPWSHERSKSSMAPEVVEVVDAASIFSSPPEPSANATAESSMAAIAQPSEDAPIIAEAPVPSGPQSRLKSPEHEPIDRNAIALVPPPAWGMKLPSHPSVNTTDTPPETIPESAPDSATESVSGVEQAREALSGRTPQSPPRLVEKRASAVGHTSRSPKNEMKHHVSNASRFSFQFGGSALEEEALEEKGRKMAKPGDRAVDDEDDEDYFDEDAMDDMDEMEQEAQNYSGTEIEDDVDEELEMPEQHSEASMANFRRRLIMSDSTNASSLWDERDAQESDDLPGMPRSRGEQTHSRVLSDDSNATLGHNIASSTPGHIAGPRGSVFSDGTDASHDFGSSPPVYNGPPRPILPHRDSGNSERNRIMSGMGFAPPVSDHRVVSNETIRGPPDEGSSKFNSDQERRDSRDMSMDDRLAPSNAPRPQAQDSVRPSIGQSLRPGSDQSRSTSRQTGLRPQSGLRNGSFGDDMYFDDGGFDQDIARPRSSGHRLNENDFDDPSFLALPGANGRATGHSRDISSLTTSSTGDGPYPSFAMGTNPSKAMKHQSQMLLEDLPLQTGPVDPKLIPQRNPSEDAKRLGLSDRVPPLPPPPGSKEAHLARLQNNLFSYHAALADAANTAESEGRFIRFPSVSSARTNSVYSHKAESMDDRSHYSGDEDTDVPAQGTEMARSASKDSTGSRAGHNVSYSPGKMGFDFGFNEPQQNNAYPTDAYPTDSFDDYGGGNDDEYDDIIAEANADALSNDQDGFYGQEFGFYANARQRADGGIEATNGGYFGADGDDGLARNKSLREPNLTPITERSEFSTRNSFIHPMGPPSAGLAVSSPITLAHLPTSPLMDKDVTSFDQLRKLRANAFGGSSASLQSDGSRGMPYHQRQGSNDSNRSAKAANIPAPLAQAGLGVDARAYSSAPNSAHPSSGGATAFSESPLTLTPMNILSSPSPMPNNEHVAVPRKPLANSADAANRKSSAPISSGGGHSRKGSDSVTYVREDGEGQQPRWVLERRRTSEQGETEVVGREVVQGSWI